VSTNLSSDAGQSGPAPVRLRAVSVTLIAAAGTDVFARSIAAAGLAVALLSVGVSWLIWHRSSPRLKVTLEARNEADPMQTRLAVEVASVGRLAVVVRALGIRDHIVVRPKGANTQPTTTSLLSMPIEPTSGAELPRSLEPTDYLEAEVTMEAIVKRWDADKEFSIVAWAETGDGRRFESRPVKVRTPRQRRAASDTTR
jgi:hypothetical protein